KRNKNPFIQRILFGQHYQLHSGIFPNLLFSSFQVRLERKFGYNKEVFLDSVSVVDEYCENCATVMVLEGSKIIQVFGSGSSPRSMVLSIASELSNLLQSYHLND